MWAHTAHDWNFSSNHFVYLLVSLLFFYNNFRPSVCVIYISTVHFDSMGEKYRIFVNEKITENIFSLHSFHTEKSRRKKNETHEDITIITRWMTQKKNWNKFERTVNVESKRLRSLFISGKEVPKKCIKKIYNNNE